MTAAVTLDRVSCVFGTAGHEVRAVDGVDLNIEAGEFFTLLGPSGSGKTTCLRMIGGFTLPTAGRVLIGGTDVTMQPPYARPVNTVFQDYALFPHMSIRDNVAYALMVRKMDKAERHRRADELLALVELAGVGDRRPAQLSGGQRQRVALARALISQPQVLLLDEPLGALDLKLREQMQSELKALQRRLGITFLFITHDQHEALSMSDRIGVFNKGRLEQVGTPHAGLQRAGHALRRQLRRRGQRARRRCGAAPDRPRQRDAAARAHPPRRGRRRARQRRGARGAVLRRLHAPQGRRGRCAAAGRSARSPGTHWPAPGEAVHLHWDAGAVHALDVEPVA